MVLDMVFICGSVMGWCHEQDGTVLDILLCRSVHFNIDSFVSLLLQIQI